MAPAISAVPATKVKAVSSSRAGSSRCSGKRAMTAEPTPSSASCVHSIMADTAPAARPTSCALNARAATSQNRKPSPMVATLPRISATEFWAMGSARPVDPSAPPA